MKEIIKAIFKRGYIRNLPHIGKKEDVKRMFLYMLRWQLSTPILAIVMIWLSGLNYWLAAIISNLIGSLIFYWVDKFIFRDKNKKREV